MIIIQKVYMQILLLLLLIYNNKVTILPFSFHAYSFVMLNFEMFQSPEPRIGRTRLLRQLQGFALLEGGHLVEAQVVPGVREAVEVDALAVHHHLRQLLRQLQLLLVLRIEGTAVTLQPMGWFGATAGRA